MRSCVRRSSFLFSERHLKTASRFTACMRHWTQMVQMVDVCATRMHALIPSWGQRRKIIDFFPVMSVPAVCGNHSSAFHRANGSRIT